MTDLSKIDGLHMGMDADSIKLGFATHLKYTLAKDKYTSTDHNRFSALAYAVRDRMIERWIETQQRYHDANIKRIYYLSFEFLMGRALGNNLINMGMYDECEKAMKDLGINVEALREQEVDAGLGNGGLGRLAACFLDSLATLSLPATGYGLRYDYGIFKQLIRDGYQVEEPDEWLRLGNPWEIQRPEYVQLVRFGGHVEQAHENGELVFKWVKTDNVLGVPYDTPIIGYGSDNVNTLRLWEAKSCEEFDFEDFNRGYYARAVEDKNDAENITKVLYPNDNIYEGKELRFRQQYLFVSCSLQDIVRRFRNDNKDFSNFPEKVAIQLNDTHPAMAVVELMRILLDEARLGWEPAWDITVRTFGYTNHTLMPEALEKWPVAMFEKYLPRHLQIIYEINRRFMRSVANKYLGDNEKLQRMSLIEEGGQKQIRMANIAVVGSHSINGVAGLHTKLIREQLFRDFHDYMPERFNNKTNGVTQRRWLLKSNLDLANLITDRIGTKWVTDLYALRELEKFVDDEDFKRAFREIKLKNKQKLADIIYRENMGLQVDPKSVFDVQIKRIHEYKRQFLNILHVIILYQRLKENPALDVVPRTFIFGGKAAPGYAMAKLIIKLITAVSDVVNADRDTNGKLKSLFLPNYRVSLAEQIFPASEVSEQISTAGTEASGTGNMKFALNGALTIGTMDGANVEMAEEIGEENMYIFGLRTHEVLKLRENGSYDPAGVVAGDGEIRKALDLVFSNFFNQEEPGLFEPFRHMLFERKDYYLNLADLRAYAEAHARIDRDYRDQDLWTRKAILNVARCGKFSSDRTIREYNDEIWKAPYFPIDMSRKRSSTVFISGEEMQKMKREHEGGGG